MAYIHRDIESIIFEITKSYAALILTGPRQTGKSTTLRMLSTPDRKEVSLDDFEMRRIAQSDPELFLSMHKPPLLIDEVQYAPQLFSRIKIEIDNGADPGSYWMTGSQPFHLMALAQESLAGRVAILKMTSLSQSEIYSDRSQADRFDHEPFTLSLSKLQERLKSRNPIDTTEQYERIWKGSMPGYISGKYPQHDIFYSSYMQTYISRDIKDLQEDVNALLFSDFVRAAACRTGQMLNVHDIALDVGVSDDSAKRWLGLLEKSNVIFYLRPYSNNLLKRTIKTPKLYFFDTGLVAYLTKYTTPDILMNGAINGALLENYVVSEIIKSYTNLGQEPVCYYYRDKDSKEIDLILESDGELHPIEIKKAASPPTELTSVFKVLDKASIPRGTGAVICTKQAFSALDRGTLIVPAWMI